MQAPRSPMVGLKRVVGPRLLVQHTTELHRQSVPPRRCRSHRACSQNLGCAPGTELRNVPKGGRSETVVVSRRLSDQDQRQTRTLLSPRSMSPMLPRADVRENSRLRGQEVGQTGAQIYSTAVRESGLVVCEVILVLRSRRVALGNSKVDEQCLLRPLRS